MCQSGQPQTSILEKLTSISRKRRSPEDKNLPAAHFEILASFRGHTLTILYSRFGFQRELQTDALWAWALTFNYLYRGPIKLGMRPSRRCVVVAVLPGRGA